VFDRFKQAETGNNRSQGGLGLGLAISLHLVELHRGSLDAYSEGEGRGSSFVMTLPLAPVVKGPILGSTDRGGPGLEDRKELEGLRVLVVDDEQDARDRVSNLLSVHGAIPIAVQNVADALDTLALYRPDVVISDIGLPGEDGYSFIRRVRQLPTEQGAGTPAAALTAYTSAEDRTQALVAGYQMHIPKPVDSVQLVATVANLARIARSMK
jgi:CheY-like chemotaxis protein